MGFWSLLFGKGQISPEEIKKLLDKAEGLAQSEDPMLAMNFIESREFKRIPPEIIGPGGALYERFLRILSEIKASVERASRGCRVDRNFENLPSVVMMPVAFNIRSQAIISLARSSGKDLICLFPLGREIQEKDARRQAELSYEFADDPHLVLMIREFNNGNGFILIRSSFLCEFCSDMETVSLESFLVELLARAVRAGFTYKFAA